MTALCLSMYAKIEEQIERTVHLTTLLPANGANEEIERLLGHLLDCAAGVCAALGAAEPERLAHFRPLRDLPVNHRCSPAEARERLAGYRERIGMGFGLLRDEDLARRIRTVFVPEGETLLTLLLGNLEHFINHKHQLFVLIKGQGIAVGTPDLYRFRGL